MYVCVCCEHRACPAQVTETGEHIWGREQCKRGIPSSIGVMFRFCMQFLASISRNNGRRKQKDGGRDGGRREDRSKGRPDISFLPSLAPYLLVFSFPRGCCPKHPRPTATGDLSRGEKITAEDDYWPIPRIFGSSQRASSRLLVTSTLGLRRACFQHPSSRRQASTRRVTLSATGRPGAGAIAPGRQAVGSRPRICLAGTRGSGRVRNRAAGGA